MQHESSCRHPSQYCHTIWTYKIKVTCIDVLPGRASNKVKVLLKNVLLYKYKYHKNYLSSVMRYFFTLLPNNTAFI